MDHAAPEYPERRGETSEENRAFTQAATRKCRIRLFFALVLRSEPFQNIGHKLPRKRARKPIDGGRVFLDKGRQVGGGLVLFPENVVVVLVENLAIAVIQRYRSLMRKLDDCCVDAL